MTQKLGQEGLNAARHFARTMPLHVVPVDLELAELAADFKVNRKLALADAFAAALAKHRKAELITGDQEFKAVEKEIKVVWIK
jgi:predicted nucleic acid-binding protein